ncbi:BsaA family SipW-dependent biofilm matrix protein [Senegalia massiliensis]|uniref:BsaA family SipW-dependent biofilm matrix protein n=1 Tax=Senegalia massiliensis TaxID=1720316 RepID=UPI001030DEFA|nr:BsaA family SipW-dependent biofilm matrix protein [Senegalia massiliensis]
MKKRLIITLSLVAIAILAIGGTMAWFTSTPEAIDNTFKAGTVDIEVNENGFENITNWNPGDETNKDVTVISKGTKKTYVRVQLTPTWSNEMSIDNVELMINSNDWILHDGWYYYKYILEENEETSKLLDSVKLLGEETGNDYQGATFTLNVKAESVQASNDAYKDVWGLTSLPSGLEEY